MSLMYCTLSHCFLSDYTICVYNISMYHVFREILNVVFVSALICNNFIILILFFVYPRVAMVVLVILDCLDLEDLQENKYSVFYF